MPPEKTLRILFAEDNPNDFELARREIKKEKIDFTCRVVETETEFKKMLTDFKPDIVISDYAMPVFDGMRALEITRSKPRHIPFIILTGSMNEETAVACMKAGADDYVIKEKIKRLPFAVIEAIEFNEIRKQKRVADQKLRDSEKRFRELAEMLPEVVFETDIKNRITYANRKGFKLFGYSTEDFRSGLNGFNLLVPEDRKRAQQNFLSRKKGEPGGSVEYTGLKKDGSTFPILLHMNTISENGEVTGFGGIIIDITARKKAEQELEKYRDELEQLVRDRTERLALALKESETSRERIDAILKSVSEGLLVTDINNRIQMMNPLSENWLNVRFSEVYNQKIENTIRIDKLNRLLHQALSGQATMSHTDIIIPSRNKRDPVILEVSTKPILNREGEPTGILATLRDVTREREIDRIKTEFLTTAAHELRTPLTTMQGFSEILLNREKLKTQQKKKFLSYINKQAVKMGNILSDMLDINRIESGAGFELDRKKFDINAAIKEKIASCRAAHPAHQFSADLEKVNRAIFADPEKIDQVLDNILTNAVHYSPGGGEIRIRTHFTGNRCQVRIEDQGIGMTRNQVNRIFEKFYRVDNSHSAPRGTGLGMSIVKLIIESHGGTIQVESRPQKGTRVIFTIPADREKINSGSGISPKNQRPKQKGKNSGK